MIRINLLGSDESVDRSGQAIIVGYVGSVVALIILFMFMHTSIGGEIQTLTAERQSLERDLNQLKEVTKEVRDLQKKRDELRDKLTVIALLNKSKTGPVRVLDSINTSIPDRAWLTELSEKGGRMKVTGLALDNVTFAAFAKQLNTLPYFPKVENLKSEATSWKGATIQKFTFDVAVNYAGQLISPELQPVAEPGAKPKES